MVFGTKIVGATYDILRGVNATIWGGVEKSQKVGKIVKTGLSGADVVVGISHALEDFGCQDYVCASLDVIGSVSSSVGLVLGMFPSTKHLTLITGSITIGCRSVRYYCKKLRHFLGLYGCCGPGNKRSSKIYC